MWQECKTIGGQYAQQSGKWGKEEDLGADPKWDGKMTSWSGREQHGRELQKTERSGKNLRRATSSSGGTQPRYKVQGKLDRKRSKGRQREKKNGQPEVLVGCWKSVGSSRPRHLERHDCQCHEAGYLMDGLNPKYLEIFVFIIDSSCSIHTIYSLFEDSIELERHIFLSFQIRKKNGNDWSESHSYVLRLIKEMIFYGLSFALLLKELFFFLSCDKNSEPGPDRNS